MACCGGSKNKTDRISNFADACYNGDVPKMQERLKIEAKKRSAEAVVNEAAPNVDQTPTKKGGAKGKGKAQARGAGLTPTGTPGQPPLVLACQKGKVEAVRFLLDNNANPRVSGPSGETPIHVAVFHGNTDVVAELLKTPARQDVNTPLPGDYLTGMTPLHIAVVTGKPDIVDLLLRAGADPNIKDSHGMDCYELGAFWARRENENMSSPYAQNNQVLQLLQGAK